MDSKQAMRGIRQEITSDEHPWNAISAGNCVEFRVDPMEQRFWSPNLSVQLNDTEAGSKLYGRFSPRPEIWTMFMAIYGVVACGVFAASIYGYVQWFLGTPPWALAIIPFGVVLIVGLHIASLIGQGLSSDQMDALRAQLDETLAKVMSEHSKQEAL